MRVLPILAAVTLAAAPGAARDRHAVPAAMPTGAPVSCIPIPSIRTTQVRSDRVIDFLSARRRGWRVTLPQGCPQLGFERRFAYATSLSQLCSSDIITVLQAPGLQRGASCGLAEFQPMTLAR